MSKHNNSNGKDTILGTDNNDILAGGNGKDKINGGNGNDAISGGNGNDILKGDDGAIAYADGHNGGELVLNGSFEAPSLSFGGWSVLSSIPGWITSFGPGIEIENNAVMAASKGLQLVELDSYGNSGMYQDIATNGDGWFNLSFDYSPRTGDAATNPIEVWWNGALLDTITGNVRGWSTHTYHIQGNSSDATTKLEFKAAGTSDLYGGFLDNVSVKAAPLTNDDVINGGYGNDELFGGVGSDTLDGGKNNDRLNGGIGDDILIGGDNNDTFILEEDFGNDVITDFGNGNDTIDLSALGLSVGSLDTDASGAVGYGDASVTSSIGADLVISIVGQGTITFIGMTELSYN
jgi:Ca2+-binding RTX toxin-like protein